MDYLQQFEFVIKNKSGIAFQNAGQPVFLKYSFFLLKVKYFLYVLDYFDVLILKIIFKKLKKNHFNTFQYKKYFEKQLQLYFQINQVTP
jgi:hypothetical protein